MKSFDKFLEESSEYIDESSMNRIHDKSKKGGLAHISAERGDKSNKENAARTKQLGKDIRGAGLPGPTKVKGEYKEAGMEKASKEDSYAVSSGKMGKKRFAKTMKKLGKKYDQDSVLHQKKAGGDAMLKPTTDAGKADIGKKGFNVGKMRPGKSSEIQTKVKGKSYTHE